MILLTKKRLSLLIASLCLSGVAHATDVTGAGSSFVFPVISAWSQDYSKSNDSKNRINYQSIGSGGGIAQIKAATVDFGASDAPMSAEDLQAGGLGQFPSVIGGIVPIVNVEGVESGELKLDGALLAKIFMGEVKKWNDPAIVALNPGVKLPETAITVVHRSDGSGTTYNFTNYLSKVSPEWNEKLKFGSTVQWPAGVGGKGNEGVSAYVKQIKGFDRLRRVLVRGHQQAVLHPVEERCRQIHQARRQGFCCCCRLGQVGRCQGLQPDHDQRSG